MVLPLSASITPDLLNENFDPIKHHLPWASQALRPTTTRLPLSVTTTAALFRTLHLRVGPRFRRIRLASTPKSHRSLPHFPIDRQICTFSPSPALRVSPFRPPRSPVSAVRLRSFLPSFPPFQYSIEAAASSDRLPKREKPLFASRVNIQSSAKEGDLGYVARSSGPIAKSPIGDATTWSGRRAV